MHAPVGDETTTVVPPSAPAQPSSFERMPARRAFEHFPIQSRGHGSDGLRRGAISRPWKLNHRVRDFAQLLLLNNLRGLFKVRTGPLLCAELHDAIRCLVRTQRVDRPLHSV